MISRSTQDVEFCLSVCDVQALDKAGRFMPEFGHESQKARGEKRPEMTTGNLVQPARMSNTTHMRILAAGEAAQGVVSGVRRTPAAADLRFVDRGNGAHSPGADITVFIGDATTLADASELRAGEELSLGIVLDAASADDLRAHPYDLSRFDQLFYAQASSQAGSSDRASHMLDMLITVVMRDGMIGTDFSDIRRVLTQPGEARFHSRRATDLAHVRQVIDATTAEANIDSSTKGLLAMIAGPQDLGIDEFAYFVERIVSQDESVDEALTTMKTRDGRLDDAYAVVIWTIKGDNPRS